MNNEQNSNGSALGGLVLVAGFVSLIAACKQMYAWGNKALGELGFPLICTIFLAVIFTAIALNYGQLVTFINDLCPPGRVSLGCVARPFLESIKSIGIWVLPFFLWITVILIWLVIRKLGSLTKDKYS